MTPIRNEYSCPQSDNEEKKTIKQKFWIKTSSSVSRDHAVGGSCSRCDSGSFENALDNSN